MSAGPSFWREPRQPTRALVHTIAGIVQKIQFSESHSPAPRGPSVVFGDAERESAPGEGPACPPQGKVIVKTDETTYLDIFAQADSRARARPAVCRDRSSRHIGRRLR